MNKLFFLLAVILLFLSSCSLNQPKEAIYLLPRNFTGPVVILFAQENSPAPGIENGFRVYKIPENGILKVSNPAEYMTEHQQYYYEDSDGSRTPIEYVYADSQLIDSDPRKSFGKLAPGDQNIYVMGVDMGSFNIKNKTVEFRSFIVGQASGSANLNQERSKKFYKIQSEFRN